LLRAEGDPAVAVLVLDEVGAAEPECASALARFDQVG